MDINLLRTFLAVARLGHFGRAADGLFLTQSAVSARIKLLEQTLDQTLLVRKRNDVHLTPAGQRLAVTAEKIVAEWEKAKNELSRHAGPDAPTDLVLGYLPDLWELALQPWLLARTASHTQHSLSLRALTSKPLIDAVSTGSVDAALQFDPVYRPGLESHFVASFDLILVGDTALAFGDVGSRPYLAVDWGSGFAEPHRQTVSPHVKQALSFNSARDARDYLLGQGGMAYLPRCMVSAQLDDGSLLKISDAPIFVRDCHWVIRSDHARHDELSGLVRGLAEAIAAAC